jgi:predicted acetyltransferase
VIELVRPTTALADSWWAAVDAFGGATIHGSGYRHTDRRVLSDPRIFGEWVDWIGRMERPDTDLPDGYVPSSNRWIVEDGRVVGTIALRHRLTQSLLVEGGHVGYAVEPGSRRRGVAHAALSLALGMAARRRIDPVLITCDDDNVGSARTIESCGGVLEDVRDGVRRYWVRTRAPARALGTDPVETATARLVLVTCEDAAAMLRGDRRDEWAADYPREDDLDAVRGLAGRAGDPDAWSSRHVVRRSDGLAVGTIGSYGPPVAGVVEVGYGLVPEARGSGLMTDVLGAYCRAVEATGTGVTAHTEPGNIASHRVLARLGFVRVPEPEAEEWLWSRTASGGVGTA